jgi:hypothetical protein
MSNPSGPDQDATPAAEETTEPAQQPQAATEEAQQQPAEEAASEPEESAEETQESSEVSTESISTSEPESEFESGEPTERLPVSGEDAATERRYSAPSGFDVRSTEIIRTGPEPATEVMSVPGGGPESPEQVAAAAVSASPRPVAPQEIPPRPPRHRSWGLVLALILVIAALAAVAIFGTVWLTHKASPKVSQEDQVRQTIQEFDVAIQRGDLPLLRGITCGSTQESYNNYPDKDWASTHGRVAAAKQYPVVASIDQVVVNDQHAEANVTTFMAYAPQVRSTRSFDLQYLDGRWKICEGPIS